MADPEMPPWRGWDWARGLTVFGGAAFLALTICIFDASTSPTHYGPRLHHVPFPICLRTDFPETFLPVSAVLIWLTRKRRRA
jgi:hypothetical protein